MTTADKASKLSGNDVHPGQKLCTPCRKLVDAEDEESDSDVELSTLEVLHVSTSKEDQQALSSMVEARFETVNRTLTDAGFTPMKSRKVSSRDKVSYAKRKAEQVKEAAFSHVSTCLHVQPSELSCSAGTSTECACQGCKDLNQLVSELKTKMSCTESKTKKLMILTLAPHSWTIERTVAEFEVSAYMVKQARSLHRTRGILADITPSGMGKRLSQETCEKVISFYQSDEVS